jgi:hypothetical protein
MYWTTWIASIKDVPVAFEERVDTKQDKGMAMKVRAPAADTSCFVLPLCERTVCAK